ncbi:MULTISPECIES: hypothetical protein [Nonomuraea]|uniref:Uncharacterized protein n=2 Tax=Nonomuraea TaxID=83681 RepID=A0A7W5YRU9_9ACTN|nr:hypothetical protein [Nonomuraea dietziae]MBB3731377.1 hypothetical protein [Nonomuraea dietziae]
MRLRRAREAQDEPVPASARRFEAFGRVMAALASEAEFIESCRDLTWWRGADHSWHISWRDGPYASEVVTLLARQVREPGLDAGLVTVAGSCSPSSAVLDVMGVRFELLAIDPMGRARVGTRPGFWRLAEALDTTRRTNARQPWEELLGG